MEDLAWQFPAEVVERAAVRFCEAVARWRGKPELETVRICFILPSAWEYTLISCKYKKASWIIRQNEQTNHTNTSMSVDSLMNSASTSPADPTGPQRDAGSAIDTDPRSRKPFIEKYFTLPQSILAQGRKRRRSMTGRGDEGRRPFSGGFS